MPVTKQRLAVPAYFVDINDDPKNDWNRVEAAGGTVGFVVPEYSFSRLNDPVDHVSLEKARAKFKSCQGKGQQILGYVDTAGGQRPPSQVLLDIENWYSRFPEIDGVFLDDGPEFDLKAPPEQKTDQFFQAYYLGSTEKPGIIRSFKGRSGFPGPKKVMLNASQFPNDWVLEADYVIVWEQSFSNYKTFKAIGPDGSLVDPPTWWRDTFERIVHVIHTCPADDLLGTIMRSEILDAGYVYVYDIDPSKPDPNHPTKSGYYRLPTYWDDEVNKVANTPVDFP